MLGKPCILRVPNAKPGDEIRIGYLTLVFTGAQKRAELVRKASNLSGPHNQARGKISSGSLTFVFLGAQRRVELLCNPYILGGTQRQARGQNQKCPRRGHIAYMLAFSTKLVILPLR